MPQERTRNLVLGVVELGELCEESELRHFAQACQKHENRTKETILRPRMLQMTDTRNEHATMCLGMGSCRQKAPHRWP